MHDVDVLPKTFLIGGDLSVVRLGFGAMRLTGQPGNLGRFPRWEEGKSLLRRAAELGINFFDTAGAYGPGWNEELISESLWPYDGLVIATKGGVEKSETGVVWLDGTPENLLKHVEDSRRRLRVDRISLYYLHCPDPAIPIENSITALAEARARGHIRHIGLSNVSLEQLERALAISPIAAVQNRFNESERQDQEVLDFCRSRGLAYVPYGPLGGRTKVAGAPLADDGYLALTGLLRRGNHVIPIPGTTRIEHLEQNARVLSIFDTAAC